MDQDRNKANLKRLYDEVMNNHRVDAADDLITSDRPDHDPNLPPEFTEGREGFKRLFRMFIGAFPDLRFDTEIMVAENDMVASYNSMRGTHQGEFMGIAPTGKSFTVQSSVWLLPLVAWCALQWRDHLIWAGAEALNFVAVWLTIAAYLSQLAMRSLVTSKISSG